VVLLGKIGASLRFIRWRSRRVCDFDATCEKGVASRSLNACARDQRGRGAVKKAWAESLGGISYDLLSDFHPHGKVATDYGVMRTDGISERAIFVVGKDGKIAWAKQYQIPEQPDLSELFKALEKTA
jgi:hypothetical protein